MQKQSEDRKGSATSRLAALRERFIEGLEPRLAVLRHYLGQLGGDGEDAARAMAQLHLAAHSLAGTAGMHGLAALSAAARRLELGVQRQLSDGTGLSRTALEALAWRLSAVEDAARNTPGPGGEPEPAGHPAASANRRVLVVDDDPAAAEIIKHQLAAEGYEAEILASLEQFAAACAAGLEPPAAVIMDMVFPEGDTAGAQAVAELRRRAHDTLPVIFVSVREDFAARLAAQRAGATAYLVKPFDPAALVLTLDQATSRVGESPYRVLVVDDDADALEITLALLARAGMNTEGVNDPFQAFDAAARLQPDCIVLDLHMPRCSGAELAAVLRADARFLVTPIVYLSGEEDFGRQLYALDMGGDLFLNKSGNPLELLGAVRVRARRTRELRRLGDSLKSSLRDATRNRHAVDRHALVSVTDRHGAIVDVNDRFCELSGYARSELLGQNHRILKSGVHPAAFYEELWNTIAGGGIWHGEICDRGKTGTLFWTACSVVPFLDDTGTPYQYMAIRTDITAHIEAEALLVAAKEQAEVANRAKTAFLATMSHELRTPLNAIIGFAQVLQPQRGGSLSAEQAAHVAEILGAGRELLGLVEDLLDITRIESGSIEIRASAVPAEALVSECAAQVEPVMRKHRVSLLIDSPGFRERWLLADPTRLRQVLLNLLSNAAKFNHPGGTVELRCEPAREGRVRISVKDSGIGIARDEQAKLFAPFQRLTGGNFVEGTGIGLALSKRLAELMGGAIGLESEPGVGSTFWVELPLAAPEQPAPTVAAPAEDTRRTVLYVDDSPENLRLMTTVLKQRPQLRLLTAASGREALEIAGRERLDLILLDIVMPGMDGFEVLRSLRAMENTRGVPVFAISADARTDDVRRAREAGFEEYVTKPFELQALLRAIDDAISTHRKEK